jgi:serpin B
MKTATLIMTSLILFGIAKAQPKVYTSNDANSFAIDIYKKFTQENDQNVFFSPISLSMALGMTYAGTKGETKSQLSSVLNFPLDDKRFHKQMGAIQDELLFKGSKGVEISLANQLWADKSYKFRCSYIRYVKKSYNAPVQRLDFSNNPNDSRLEINKWVESQTKNRIKDLLPDGSISNLTAMVLTNAIYFKGQWDNKFEEELTEEGSFVTSSGKQVKAKMMNANDKFKIYQGNGVQLLELPYAGKDFSMLVMLPNKGTSLNGVEKHIKLEDLNHFIDLMIESDVRISFPKFKFEAKYALKPVLAEMGMPIAFSNDADLSGMSRKKDLKIDEVFHKAFVEVSEEGTEAAAATAVVIVRKSISIPVEFIADRPFMFLIRENANGHILFMGRVTNPNI